MAAVTTAQMSVNSSLQKMGFLTMEPREELTQPSYILLDAAAKHKNEDKGIKRKSTKLKQNEKYLTVLTRELLGNVLETKVFTLLQSNNLMRF